MRSLPETRTCPAISAWEFVVKSVGESVGEATGEVVREPVRELGVVQVSRYGWVTLCVGSTMETIISKRRTLRWSICALEAAYLWRVLVNAANMGCRRCVCCRLSVIISISCTIA